MRQLFLKKLSYCIYYWFYLSDRVVQRMILLPDKRGEIQKDYNAADLFGKSLINYLQKFNENSLISNILTY